MRYAILSDVHGNLEALEAVLADAVGRADGVLCLGDTVGYGADPLPCVERIAERAQAVVSGNHDWAVADRLDLAWFNPYARAAAEWTRERLDADHRGYLGSLPLVAEVSDATLVHASPAEPEAWDYLISAGEGFAAFAHFQTRWCFVGHSHIPGVWSLGSAGPGFQPGVQDVRPEPGRRYLVNVGSVGQPRDRDARAAYAVWDAESGALSIRRVRYDVEGARAKIIRAGLPGFLAERLSTGR